MKKRLFLLAALGTLGLANAQSRQTAPVKKPQADLVSAAEEPPVREEKIVAEPGKEVVAVYHFTSARDYSYDYAVGVGNAVEGGFVRSTRFTVVERNRFGTLKEEDKFKEANTSELVAKASRFGAKTIVTGHIVGVSHGDLVNAQNQRTGNEYADISLSFKIIDVESGQIKMSEVIRGRGEGNTSAEAYQNAYLSIDKLMRSYIGTYLPQRFKFMSIGDKEKKKDYEYLKTFKIWGGADNGLKAGDVVERYTLSYIVNPNNNKKVEEKKLLAQANIIEVNSGSTATCAVINPKNYKGDLLSAVAAQPESIVVEYKGNWYQKPKSFWEALAH